ncbi:MAG: hypothetical protein KAV87_51410 [Desulfobacteraceae bacterium]|nr:hypothetical protein [Desulfobacteraceae bacterium]
MIKKLGYRNVKAVRGGGKAMEKFFDHFYATYYGSKIISPLTGKVIEIGR